jgi:hypothetical protein
MHQPRHAIDINTLHAIDINTLKVVPSRSPNGARAVDHGINAAYQSFQAVNVFKRALDPIDTNS